MSDDKSKKVITKDRSTVLKMFVIVGLLVFGPFCGLVLINLNDFHNHSMINKIWIFTMCVLWVGPAWGYLTGRIYWQWMQNQKSRTDN